MSNVTNLNEQILYYKNREEMLETTINQLKEQRAQTD